MKNLTFSFAFLILLCFEVNALTVTFSPSTIGCGTTTVTATFDCNFSGSGLFTSGSGVTFDQISGIYTITNGEATMDLTIDENTPNPFTVNVLVLSSDMGCAIAAVTMASNTIDHDCILPPNDDCADAIVMPIEIGPSCTTMAFSTDNITNSGNDGCANGYNDLWYEFTAVNPTLYVEFTSGPGNLAYVAIYDACGGSYSVCQLVFFSISSFATIGGLTVGDTYKLRTQILASSSGDQEICLRSDSAMPVTLSSFTVENSSKGNMLRWKTESEVNFKEFVVEKSVDGINDFKDMNSFSATSTYGGDYNYLDSEISSSGVYYYRLKMVDLDGMIVHSDIIDVEVDLLDQEIELIPQPADQYVRLNVAESLQGDVWNLDIVNLQGQKVLSVDHTYYEIDDMNINTSEFSDGVYYMIYRSGPYNLAQKLVIRH